jgi:hypothetical protein
VSETFGDAAKPRPAVTTQIITAITNRFIYSVSNAFSYFITIAIEHSKDKVIFGTR